MSGVGAGRSDSSHRRRIAALQHAIVRHWIVRRLRGALIETPGTILILAAVVGVTTGLLAAGLIELVSWIQGVAFGAAPGPLLVVLVPTLGGLLVGLLVTYAVPEARGGGVTQVMESIALHGGRIGVRVAPGKLVASGLSIGSGASGGREAPIVQIGAALGSLFGRMAALTEDRKRELLAAGAAAGIAASFNAPIGGMLFAIEVILGGFRMRYLQVIVVASVAGSVTAREIVGERLIYNPPSYGLGAPTELLLYAVLGVAAAGVGWALSRGEHLATKAFERIRVWPPLRTAIGGFAVGLLALMVPEVLGTGDELPPVPGAVHEPIARLLDGQFAAEFEQVGLAAAGLVLLLLLAKLVATCISIGSGFSVGSFGPAFFLGAALGAAIGHMALVALPESTVEPGALALAGMAAVLGAAARAPLTGIIIAFELTGDYGMVIPLMLATGFATFTADLLDRDSMYTRPLRERGIIYSEPEDVDIMQLVRVGEIMTRDPERVAEDLPFEQLHQRFARSGPHGFVVVAADDPSRLVGVVSISDVTSAQASADGQGSEDRRTAGDICTRSPLTVTPEDPVFRALQRMAALDVGRVPVVSSEDHTELVGLVRRADVVHAYQQALRLTVESQQRQAASPLRDLVGTRSMELVVADSAEIAGQRIREIAWPPRTIVASIRRNAEVLTPSGDTEILPGDVLLAITSSDQTEELRGIVTAERSQGEQ
ncbi:MAG: chloride channel protein [Nitriliruptoraceae bacterium]